MQPNETAMSTVNLWPRLHNILLYFNILFILKCWVFLHFGSYSGGKKTQDVFGGIRSFSISKKIWKEAGRLFNHIYDVYKHILYMHINEYVNYID